MQQFDKVFPTIDTIWNDKKVLIIGGTGQTGSYLAQRLVRYNADVHILSRGETGSSSFLGDELCEVTEHEIDILESIVGKEDLDNLIWLERFDYVFNCIFFNFVFY